MTEVKQQLISTLKELRLELNTLYDGYFLRLTDIEMDYKYHSHDLLMERIIICLKPLIISGNIPEWMKILKIYLQTKEDTPRSCFKIIDHSLSILAE